MSDKAEDTQKTIEDLVAKAGETATPTETDKVETKEASTKEGTKKGDGATKRIRELVTERTEAEKAIEALTAELGDRRQREAALQAEAARLGSIVENVRQLAGHESQEVREAVFMIDKVLKGQWEPPKTETEKANVNTDVTQLLSKHSSEVDAKIDAHQEAVVMNLVKQTAVKALESLPEEYTAKDRARLAHVLPDNLDLDAIKADPSTLDQAIEKAMKDTLDWYGEPIGRVKAETLKEAQPKEDPAKPKFATPKEQVKALLDIPWDAVDEKGKPKQSEKDYIKALQAAMNLDKSGILDR